MGLNKMNLKHQRLLLISLITFGFLISLHLIQTHSSPASEGEICDINGVLSCTLVNTSKYSEIFHVPVAVLGAIWFIIAFLLAWNIHKKHQNQTLLFLWTIIGLISIIYFITIEIILQAICLYCTTIHIIIVILFYLNPKPTSYYNDFANCLSEKDVKFYGAFWCSHCARQKQLFGDAMQQINYIECSLPDRSAQTQICITKNITGYPTWEFADNTRLSGEQTLETLSKKTGCALQKNR